MTVKAMRKVSTLYNGFIALENSADLEHDNLTLSDYNELSRVLTVLGGGENSRTVCKNVMLWITQRVDATVYESHGFYIISL